MIEAFPLPVVTVDHDQRIGATNKAARGILGPHIEGRHYISALRQPALLDAIERAASERDQVKAAYLSREGDTDTTYIVGITPLESGLILVFEDRSAAEEVSKLRRDFVANVSHELRTPLTALMGFIETLRGPARDDAAARDRFLEHMVKESGRMSRLVEDLLALSRVEGTERLRPEETLDLAYVVREALSDVDHLLKTAASDVVFEVEAADAQILGDAEQLRQVFRNLVENAVKYGVPKGAVTLRLSGPQQETRLRAPGYRVSVHNDGPPIPGHHLARLTERFYRVDSHRSREVGGTGLGLAIVKHVLNRHRGRLEIVSDLDHGTTFSVILPAEPQIDVGGSV